jgi:hypothetical protein
MVVISISLSGTELKEFDIITIKENSQFLSTIYF